jgi:hypothetical protein
MHPSHSAAVAGVLAAVHSLALAQTAPIYVDDDAAPGGDGASWRTAFRDLQDALDLVRKGRSGWDEVRVAQGTYTPDRATLEREHSFVVNSAVSLIGGFAGLGAPNPDERDPARFVSVLSGDLEGNDTPGFTNRDDNSYHVVDLSRSEGYSGFDGFTIRGGHADGDPVRQHDHGGAFFSTRGHHTSVALIRCTVTDNFAHNESAAVSVDRGWATMVDCTIAGNRTAGSGIAGAVYSRQTLIIDRCRFADNGTSGAVAGSAVACDGYLRIQDSLFDSNGPDRAVVYASGETTIRRSTFAGNHTGPWPTLLAGGALNHIDGCIFRNPHPANTGFEIRAPRVTIRHSCVDGGASAIDAWNEPVEWHPSNIDADPLFESPDGPDADPATWRDNDYSLAAASPCVDAGEPGIDVESHSDVRNNPRYISARGDCRSRADMGAIERQAAAVPLPPVRVYVRADATADGDGLTWATALPTIDAALATPGVREVWIAAGVYTPTDWAIPFTLSCRVTLVGGFNGSETSTDERDPAANPTVLSADMLGNDDATPDSRTDNAPTILSVTFGDVTLDAVVIRGSRSNAALNGPALAIASSSVTLRSCTIEDCERSAAWASGGGIVASDSTLTLDSCTFRNNAAVGDDYASGAAVWAWRGSFTARDTRFEDNTSTAPGSVQGGALLLDTDTASFTRCTFVGNAATSTGKGGASGGALRIYNAATRMVNCSFINNRSTSQDGWASTGAAGISAWSGPATIVGCTFASNVAQGAGASTAALAASGDPVEIINSTFHDNHALARSVTVTAGALAASGKDVTLANCILWGNTAPSGTLLEAQVSLATAVPASHNCIQGWDASIPGDGNFGDDPMFTSTTDLRPAPGSACIDAADADFLPADTADIDADHDTVERLPLDAANRTRTVGVGLDVGAFERQPDACRADHTGDAVLNSADFFAYLADYFANAPRADFNASGAVSVADFFDYLNAFLAGC